MLNLVWGQYVQCAFSNLSSVCKQRHIVIPVSSFVSLACLVFKLMHVLFIVANFIKFSVRMKFEFIGFKLFVQSIKDIIHGILKVVPIRMINDNAGIIMKY
jgi:hypothetical protein